MKSLVKTILCCLCLLFVNIGFCEEEEDIQITPNKTYAPGEAEAYKNFCAIPENDPKFEKYTTEKLHSMILDDMGNAELHCEIGLRLIQEYLDKSKQDSKRTQLSLIKVYFQPGIRQPEKLPKAVYLTGVSYYLMYKQGEAVEHTYSNAVKYIKEAAEMGYAPAQCQLGMIYYYRGDCKKAIKWHKKAALQEYPMSMYEYATYIMEGEFIQRDMKEAAKWFEKAAEKGIMRAQFEIGVCYSAGDGVPKNPQKAFKWISKSAQAGHPRSMYALGIFYLQGEGTEQDIDKGIEWIKKAASANLPEAKQLLKKIKEQNQSDNSQKRLI